MKNFFLIALVLIQIAFAFGQKNYVELSITPETIERGDQFTIEIRTNVPGKLSLDNLPPSFSLVQYSEGSSITTMNQSTGEMEMTFISTYTGTIDVPGEYNIGPAFVTSSKGSYSSKKVSLTVEKEIEMYSDEITIKQLKQPAFGLIQTNKKKIYEGEPLIASAKVYSKYYGRIVDPESYTLQGALDNHPIGAKNRLTVGDELVQGVPFYTFVFDKQLIFPTGSGKVKIEPFKVKLVSSQILEITSAYASVDIVPLPANPPKDFIGGVGDFNVRCSVNESNIKQGEVFKLKVTVDGEGNLHNTKAPSLKLPKGFTVYGDPVVKEDYRFNSAGCKGKITYEYNILTKVSGSRQLPPITVSYFDTKKESYVTAYSRDTIDLKIERDPNFKESKTVEIAEQKEVELSSPPIYTEPISVSNDTFFNSPLYWGTVGAPLLSALLFLIFTKIRKEDQEETAVLTEKRASADKLLSEAYEAHKSGNTDEFYRLTEEALRTVFSLKLGTPPNLIQKKEMIIYLEENKLGSSAEQLSELLTACEQSRYGMMSSTEDLARHESALKNLSKQLR